MAGITQGKPELAVGEPIQFGDIDGFELEHHPISDRLIIRDTANGTVAYVRADRGGEIGGDGVLVKALKESKPMNDKGRTYDTIQEAERQASSWVFVPPGTYNESIEINTDGLTIKGSGYNSLISTTGEPTIIVNGKNVSIIDLAIENNASSGFVPVLEGNDENMYIEGFKVRGQYDTVQLSDNSTIVNSTFEGTNSVGNMLVTRDSAIISGCRFTNADNNAITDLGGTGGIIANNIITNPFKGVIIDNNPDNIIIGNRISGADNDGIDIQTSNNIVANNRVSDSGASDISDSGTGNLLDGNLTGASN